MHGLVRLALLSSMLLGAATALADECNEDSAADFNSRIQANFTIMESSDTQDVAVQQKIEALQQKFSEAGKLHTDALESHDQAALDEACARYEAILEEQASLGE
jgi:hypothetical protein